MRSEPALGACLQAPLFFSVFALLSACNGLPATEIPEAPRPGSPIVVFDIDGTLTPRIRSFDKARPDAAEAVRAFEQRGYTVVYLSARIPLFQSEMPAWLQRNGFPDGNIHVPQTDLDQDDPATFKERILNVYVAREWQLAAAFGDSSTDFEAYARAGMSQSQVYALLRKGKSDCEPGLWNLCLADWSSHVTLIGGAPP